LTYADTKVSQTIKIGSSSLTVYKLHYVKNAADCLAPGQSETRSCKYDAVKKVSILSGTMLNQSCEVCPSGKVPSLDGSTCETMTASTQACTDLAVPNGKGTKNCLTDAKNKTTCETKCNINSCNAGYTLQDVVTNGVTAKKCVAAATCNIVLSDVKGATSSVAALTTGTAIISNITLKNVSSASYQCTGGTSTALTVKTPVINKLVMGTSDMTCSISYKDEANKDVSTPCTTTVKVIACKAGAVSAINACAKTPGGADQVKTCKADGSWGECAPSCGASQTYDAAKGACVCANGATDAKCTSCGTYAAFDKSKPAKCVPNVCPAVPATYTNASACANFNKNVKSGTKISLVSSNSCNAANSCEYSCNEGFFLNAKGVCEKAECSLTYADTKTVETIKIGESKSPIFKAKFVSDVKNCVSETRTCTYNASTKVLSLTGSLLNSACKKCPDGTVPTPDGTSCGTTGTWVIGFAQKTTARKSTIADQQTSYISSNCTTSSHITYKDGFLLEKKSCSPIGDCRSGGRQGGATSSHYSYEVFVMICK
jgi:hypothetical protein